MKQDHTYKWRVIYSLAVKPYLTKVVQVWQKNECTVTHSIFSVTSSPPNAHITDTAMEWLMAGFVKAFIFCQDSNLILTNSKLPKFYSKRSKYSASTQFTDAFWSSKTCRGITTPNKYEIPLDTCWWQAWYLYHTNNRVTTLPLDDLIDGMFFSVEIHHNKTFISLITHVYNLLIILISEERNKFL